MIIVKFNSESYVFNTLDDAMVWAKALGEFVIIQSGDHEIAGKFGVDQVSNGKLPNGQDYTWKKRRKR